MSYEFLALFLVLAAPLLALGALVLVVGSSTGRQSDDAAARVAEERSLRAEMDKERLGLLLRAL